MSGQTRMVSGARRPAPGVRGSHRGPPARGGVPLHKHRCIQQTCPPTRTRESAQSIFGPRSMGGSPSPGGL